jgi:hypothetical protein
MQKVLRTSPTHVLLAILLLLFPLGTYAYIGQFSRYLADDYCTASTLRHLGFFGSQIDWYNNWSGRFSFTFLINATQAIGAGITPLLPLLLLIIWLIVLTLTINRVFRLMGRQIPLFWSLLIGEFIIYATLSSTPDIYQSLYWQTGAVTYTFPLILFTLFWGWVSSKSLDNPREKPGVIFLLASGLLAFLAGGFSETFVAMQTTALAVTFLILLLIPGRDRKLHPALLAAGLVGSIAAMIIVVLAPGNSVRQGLMPTSPDILWLVGWSLRHGLAFAAKSAISTPINFANSLIFPAILMITGPWNFELSTPAGKSTIRRWGPYIAGIPILVYLIIVASVAPSVYATSAYPAERALITAQYVLTIGLVIFGFLAGIILKSKLQIKLSSANAARALGIVLLGVGVLISTQRSRMIIPSARSFAQQWDRRDRELRFAYEQGMAEARAPSLPHMGNLAEIDQDPEEWINLCVAGSYGLERITSIE